MSVRCGRRFGMVLTVAAVAAPLAGERPREDAVAFRASGSGAGASARTPPAAAPQEGAAPGGGEGTLRSARLVVDLTGANGEAEVRVEYELEGAGHGPVEASVLAFGGAEVAGVRSGEGGEVAIRPVHGAAGALALAAHEEGGATRVRAAYTVRRPVVERGGSLRGFIPVVTVDRRPAEARPGLFRAELLLPEAWTVSEAFPSGLRRAGPPSDGAVVWVAELPVVPSLLSFRAHPDLDWHPGLPLVLDLLVGAALLGFVSVGWRHLGRVVR